MKNIREDPGKDETRNHGSCTLKPSLSPFMRMSLFRSPCTAQAMEEDPPLIRCPACGSVYTVPKGHSGMWECRHHLCRVIFPVQPVRGWWQEALLAEDEPAYPEDDEESDRNLFDLES